MGTTLRLAIAPTMPHMGGIVSRGRKEALPGRAPGRVETRATCSWPHAALPSQERREPANVKPSCAGLIARCIVVCRSFHAEYSACGVKQGAFGSTSDTRVRPRPG